MRDYALQYLAKLLEGRGHGRSHLAAWRSAGLPALLEAARDTAKRSAGTALLGLHFLSTMSAGAEDESLTGPGLDALVESAARDGNADPAARGAAFQIAATRARTGLLDAARGLAKNGTCPSGLRVAAIYYLGVCGGGADVGLLSGIEAEKDLRYASAAGTARARIVSR